MADKATPLAQGAGATAVAEENAPQPAAAAAAATEQREPTAPRRQVPGSGSLLDAVLKNLELPADVLTDLNKRRKPAAAEKPANLADLRRQQIAVATGTEEADEPDEPTEEEAAAEQDQPTAEEPVQPQGAAAAEEPELGAELEIPEPPEDWPDDARAQVIDARKKLRRRTDELNLVAGKAQELLNRAQIAEAQPPRAPGPTFNEPLPDVMSFPQLEAAKQSAKRAKRWAERHPEGVEKDVDKGPEGEPITEDMSAEDILRFKETQEDILAEAVPRRAVYLEKARKHSLEAATIYPELFQNTRANQEGTAILQMVPEIMRAPDFLLWIGRAVLGPRGTPKNGAPKTGGDGKPLSKAAETILNAPRLRPAPVASAARSMEEAGGSGAEPKQTARTELLKSGLTDKDLEQYIRTRLSSRQGKGGRAAVLA